MTDQELVDYLKSVNLSPFQLAKKLMEPSEDMISAAINAPMPLVHLDSDSARRKLEFRTRLKAMVWALKRPVPPPPEA